MSPRNRGDHMLCPGGKVGSRDRGDHMLCHGGGF